MARPGSSAGGALPPFSVVLDEHGPAVLRYCRVRVPGDEASDCFQETMMAALRGYDALRDPQAVLGWLLSIASRKIVDHFRGSARRPQPMAAEVLEAVASPAGRDSYPSDAEPLWALVGQLPAKQQQAVLLHYRHDLTHAQAGEVMGTSEAAARRNAFEGVRRLRQLAEHHDLRPEDVLPL